jgi:hypothetical protein
MFFKKKTEPELTPLEKFIDYECRLAVLVNVAINESGSMPEGEYNHACTVPIAKAISQAEMELLGAFQRFVGLLDEATQ